MNGRLARRLSATMLAVAVLLGTSLAAPVAVPSEREIDAVASELRCVVCQTLSVADSPSEMARQMRDVIREKLAAGETPAQVKAYFVARYGEWVLLAPPARGFGLLAWALPLGGLGLGLVVAALILRRWAVRGGAHARPDDEIDPEALAAVRDELKRRG